MNMYMNMYIYMCVCVCVIITNNIEESNIQSPNSDKNHLPILEIGWNWGSCFFFIQKYEDQPAAAGAFFSSMTFLGLGLAGLETVNCEAGSHVGFPRILRWNMWREFV